MDLIQALRLTQPSSLAFVGSGGKTTAIFRIARELLSTSSDRAGVQTVIVSTTTHLGTWQAAQADHVFEIKSASDISNLKNGLPSRIVLIVGEERNNRLSGLSLEHIDIVHQLALSFQLPLLIEADGAHGRPLKAPAEHEPVIPDFVDEVVVVVGLEGLGKPLTRYWVHRPEIFSEITGLRVGMEVTAEAIVKIMLSPEGGLKNIPSERRKKALLNQADTNLLQERARWISKKLIDVYDSTIITSLNRVISEASFTGELDEKEVARIHAVSERIGGIVLAAGKSNRFGAPKQLLMWRGEPLVRHTAMAALNAGLSPVVVVVGSSGEEVASAIKDLPVRIANNEKWMSGMSSSIRLGLNVLSKPLGGVIFLQADQPHVPVKLIESLVEEHEKSLASIIAPQIDGQRGNPVLFDTRTFPDLQSLQGDIGGRALFDRYTAHQVSWHDKNILIDIDTPEDFEYFLRIYP